MQPSADCDGGNALLWYQYHWNAQSLGFVVAPRLFGMPQIPRALVLVVEKDKNPIETVFFNFGKPSCDTFVELRNDASDTSSLHAQALEKDAYRAPHPQMIRSRRIGDGHQDSYSLRDSRPSHHKGMNKVTEVAVIALHVYVGPFPQPQNTVISKVMNFLAVEDVIGLEVGCLRQEHHGRLCHLLPREGYGPDIPSAGTHSTWENTRPSDGR